MNRHERGRIFELRREIRGEGGVRGSENVD